MRCRDRRATRLCTKQVGFTATQIRLVYEKHSQMKKLERRVGRIKSNRQNRASFVAIPGSPLEEEGAAAVVEY